MKRLSSLLFSSGLVAAISGCTSFQSQSSPETEPAASEPRIGIHYFLPRAKLRLTGNYLKADKDVIFQIKTARVIEPDRARRYFLKYEPNAFYEDEGTLAVDDNGLLQSVNATSSDQSPAILESLTDTSLSSFKVGAQLDGTGVAGVAPHPFIFSFDPLNSASTQRVKSALKQMGIEFRIEQTAIGSVRAEKQPISSTKVIESGGAYYHPPLALTLSFRIRGLSPEMDDSVTYVIPNYHVVECFQLRRGALVKHETQLGFVAGMLNRISFRRPSQILAVAQIPQRIVGKAADAIPAIIKVKNEAGTRDVRSQTAVLEAQRDYLQAQIELLKKQAEFEALTHSVNARQERSSQTGMHPEAGSSALSESSVPKSAGSPVQPLSQ